MFVRSLQTFDSLDEHSIFRNNASNYKITQHKKKELIGQPIGIRTRHSVFVFYLTAIVPAEKTAFL